ncbi:MAG: hypothetical protein LBC79_00815 [Deltaproteobacteria bacterium]|nr:hypothetical protein [Deltaproteobacteria bacterium]
MQTRRFETNNNKTMLSAAGAVLQDLGFTLDESEATLGILVASKRRDATSAGQVAGAIFLALLTGAVHHVDKEQYIRVAMVMREIASAPSAAEPQKEPAPAKPASAKSSRAPKAPPAAQAEPAQTAEARPSGQSTVRVTFQRVVFNTANDVTRAEQIDEPEIYREFFDKLSQSVFLEAHEI